MFFIWEKQSLLLQTTGYTSCFMQVWFISWSSERQPSLVKLGSEAKRTPMTTCVSRVLQYQTAGSQNNTKCMVSPYAFSFNKEDNEIYKCVLCLYLFLQVQSKNTWFRKSSWVTWDLSALWASHTTQRLYLTHV